MKTKLMTWAFGALMLGAPVALVIACSNNEESKEEKTAVESVNEFNNVNSQADWANNYPTRSYNQAQDVTHVMQDLRAYGAFTVSGPSNALVLMPNLFNGLELSVRRANQAEFEPLTSNTIKSWGNIWNNNVNDFTFNYYDVKIRATGGEWLYQQGSSNMHWPEITMRYIRADWSRVAPRVIDNNVPVSVTVDTTADRLAINSSEVVNNTSYQFSFDPANDALPQGIRLTTSSQKRWYSQAEMTKILADNAPHYQLAGWSVPKLFARVSANAGYELRMGSQVKQIWSAPAGPEINRSAEVTSAFNAMQRLWLTGNQFDAKLSASDSTLAELLFDNRHFFTAVYTTESYFEVHRNYVTLIPNSTTESKAAYVQALQNGIAIDRANSVALKSQNTVRIKLIALPNNNQRVEYGDWVNWEVPLSSWALANVVDARNLRQALITPGALKVTGASNAARLTFSVVDANFNIKVKLHQSDAYVSPQELAASVSNWWDNANNKFVASTFYYEITPKVANTYLFDSSDLALASAERYEGIAPISTSGINQLVITDDLQLEQFKLTGATTEALSLTKEGSEALPNNVTYEFAFNSGADSNLIQGFTLPAGLTWKPWFSFNEMAQILQANNLYTYHAWKVESIDVRARSANANLKLAQTQNSRQIWSFETNKFELMTVAPEVGRKRQWVIPTLANLKVTEYRDDAAPNGYWLSEDYGLNRPTVMDRILQKLATRLPVGPEIGALNEIVFAKNMRGMAAAYSPSQKLITFPVFPSGPYPSTQDGSYDLLDYDFYTELKSEYIFEPLYHEYGHHITFEYVNSDFINDDIAPYVPWQTRIGTSEYTAVYDADFYNSFVKELGWDDTSKTNFATQKMTWNGVLTPLSNVFSRSELLTTEIGKHYDLTGKTVDEIYEMHYKIVREIYNTYGNFLATVGPSLVASPNATAGFFAHYLPYYFSFEEQVPLKFQLASMLYPTSEHGFYDDKDGFIKAPNGDKTMLHYEGYSYPFSEGVKGANYAPDYLFNTVTNADGTKSVDASHANALMGAFQKRMGYTDKAALAHIWWENNIVNDIQPSENGEPGYWPAAGRNVSDQRFKFGGYVANDSYKYVGYYDYDNNFRSVPIFVAPFNFRAKTEITSSSYAPADPTKLNYYYLTKKSVNFAWIDQPLYFSDDAVGTNVVPMEGVNIKASSDLPGLQITLNQTPNTRTVYARTDANNRVNLRLAFNKKTMHNQRYQG